MSNLKEIENYTLGEIKQMCEELDDCENCPVHTLCDECFRGVPSDWNLEKEPD